MGLCQNVYRRGGVYWWRRRMNLIANRESAYLHLSLRVRDPAQARVLALRVGAEADRLAQLVRTRMLDGAQQVILLKRFVAEQVTVLEAAAVKHSHTKPLDCDGREVIEWDGKPADALKAYRQAERHLSIAFDALAAQGPAARIRSEDEATLRARGFSDEELYFAGLMLEEMVSYYPAFGPDRDSKASGKVGPDYAFFERALREAGVEPDAWRVEQARRLWMRAQARVLADCDRRYSILNHDEVDAALQAVYAERRSQAAAPLVPVAPASPILVPTTTTTLTPAPTEVVAPASCTAPPTIKSPAPAIVVPPGVDRTISGQMAVLIAAKRGDEWKLQKRGEVEVCDSEDQYALLGRMLIKMVGDDLTAITGETALKLRLLLKELPRSFGKAPADWKLTFQAATAKAKGAGKRCGREKGTVRRWLTQYQAFLRFLTPFCTVNIDIDAIEAHKPKDTGPKNGKRQTLDAVSYRTLFAHETWAAESVIHDSLYWVPILARYMMPRLNELCALPIDHVDFDSPIPCLVFQESEYGGVKSEARRVPIPPEALRLGFRAYYERIKALGFKMLFPDLPARGTRTDWGDLFNKKFLPILEERVPGARAKLATLHSSRKKGNTELHNAGVPDSLCCQFLGHTQEGVNASVYLDPLNDQVKLDAMNKIEIVTAHIPARPIRLSPLLDGHGAVSTPRRVRRVRPQAPAMADVGVTKASRARRSANR